MERLHFTGMEIEARDALCLVTHGEEDSQSPLVHLLVDEELGEAAIDLVFRVAVRAEHVAYGGDRLVEGAFRLARLRRLCFAQLKLFDPALDGSHDCQQMQQLLDGVNARLKLDRFAAWSLGSHGESQAAATHLPLNSAVLICDESIHFSSP